MIGGEFEIDSRLLTPGPSVTGPRGAFSSGRGALHAIVRDAMARHGVRTVLLPEYLCRSMAVAVLAAECAYAYYPVGDDLLPDMVEIAANSAAAGGRCAVVLVDYFGLTDPLAGVEALGALARRPIVVADLSHAAFGFALPAGADYAFTTYRKSLPTPDGAPVLARDAAIVPPSGHEAPFVAEKIAGNVVKARAEEEGLPDDAYLDHTRRGERMLDEDPFYGYRMSDASAAILGNLDVEDAARRRRENFVALAGMLGEIGVAPIRPLEGPRVPLFLPVLLEGRDEVRAALAEKRIFCPVHWPWPSGLPLEPPRPGARLWTRELSLVVDQRYGGPEMRRLFDEVKRALGGRRA